MRLRSFVSGICCLAVVAALNGCKESTTLYVNSGKVITGIKVYEGQILAWRATDSGHPLTIKVPPKLCVETGPLHAKADSPAVCTIRKQEFGKVFSPALNKEVTAPNSYKVHVDVEGLNASSARALHLSPDLAIRPLAEGAGDDDTDVVVDSCKSCP